MDSREFAGGADVVALTAFSPGGFMATPFARTTRALALDSPRYALTALAIAGIAVFIWVLWFSLGRVAVYEVSRGARIEVGSAPRDVSTVEAGRLIAVHLVIGQRVHAGDLLVELDAEAQKLKLNEANERLSSFPLRIASLRREIDALEGVTVGDRRATYAGVQSAQARVQEATAAARFSRDFATRERAESQSGGTAQIDALKSASEASKAEAARRALSADASKIALDARIRSAQNSAQIESLTGDLIAAQTEAAMTQQSVAQLELEIANRQVRAPVDGVVGDVAALSPGAFIGAGQTLATIVPSGDLMIVAVFNPATALGRVASGQQAQFRLDGYSWAQYGIVKATVLRVAGDMHNNAMRVELKVADASKLGIALRHGMTGRVEVNVESTSPAMLLLRSTGQIVQ
jgi:membrane fusion protein, adhesin transport system